MMPALMDFLQSRRGVRGRQGREGVDVGEDGEGVVEAADEVLAGG